MRSGIIRGFSSAFSPGNQVPVGEAEPIRACWPKNGLLGAPVADLRIPQGIVYRTIGLRDDRSIDAVVCEIGCSSTGQERDQLNDSLRRIIDEQTEPWGIKVTTVEIKDVEIPEAMQRAMARQAEAERERRAKIINAEGEFQAAQKIYDAAEILSRNPAALQLRYLQTLLELGGEKSTIVFPLPMDLIKPFLGASRQTDGEQAAPGVDLSTVGGALGRLINGSEPLAAKANGAGDEAAGAGKR